jgi:hypothetical protein
VTWRAWHVLVVCVLCAFLAAASSMVYANRVARESERKWCTIVVTIDDSTSSSPQSTTPTGKKFATAMAQLRRDLGCP